MKSCTCLYVIFTFFSAVSVFGAESHCAPDEQVIFSCGIRDSSKVLSLCASRQLTKEEGYIQYRFGAVGKSEFGFPPSREGSRVRFSYSHYFRAQADRTEVRFRNGKYEYSVFSDYEGDMRPAINESGVRISDTSTEEEKTLLCKGKTVNQLALLAPIIPCGGEDSSGECQ